LSALFTCSDCWRIHGPALDCVLDALHMRQTEEGRAELARRKAEVYARAAGEDNKRRFEDGWHWAQKHHVPMPALRALRAGPGESKALTAARAFIRDREKLFLVLLGPTGVGKTLAAALVALDFCARWPWNQQSTGGTHSPLHYVDAATLTRLSAFDDEAQRYVQDLKDARLLVLEDAGDEGTELGKGVLVELLMHRHATERRTVLTSNLTREGFKARYGDAVADRVRSSGLVPNLSGEKSRRAAEAA
jgi:DNA replication protein DnaC